MQLFNKVDITPLNQNKISASIGSSVIIEAAMTNVDYCFFFLSATPGASSRYSNCTYIQVILLENAGSGLTLWVS